MNLDNNTIRDVLTSYGKVLEVRYDYLHVDGNRVPWWNGTRHIDMCELKSVLLPTIKVRYGQKDIKIKMWHVGQTHIECRWCKVHIVKGEHNCPQNPQRRCFNCGSMSYINAECPVGKQCFISDARWTYRDRSTISGKIACASTCNAEIKTRKKTVWASKCNLQ